MTTPKQALQTIDQVTQRLAKITTLEEAKNLRDQAAAIQQYAKASNQGRLTANQATYLKIMCERRAGELLAEIPRKQGNRKGEKGLRSLLEQSGICTSTAHTWQAFAKVPASEFEDLLAQCNEEEDDFLTMLVVSMVDSWLNRHEKPKKKERKGEKKQAEDHGAEEVEEAKKERDDTGEPEDSDGEPEASDELEEVDSRELLLELLTEAVELCPKVDGFKRKQSTLRSWIRLLEGGDR